MYYKRNKYFIIRYVVTFCLADDEDDDRFSIEVSL